MIIKKYEYPVKQAGVSTSFSIVKKKGILFGVEIVEPAGSFGDKSRLAYQCQRCGNFQKAEKGISNAFMNRLHSNALKRHPDTSYVEVRHGCDRCDKEDKKSDPRHGRNQFGDRKTYTDLAPLFAQNGFTLVESKLPKKEILKVSNGYFCTCNKCGQEQKHSANDMHENRSIACRYCGTKKFSESRIRVAMESLFGCKFPTVRRVFSSTEIEQAFSDLDLMKNEINGKKRKLPRSLELDLLNEKMKLALEHNGDQHYKTSKDGFVKDLAALKDLQANDRVKKYLCEKKGITLIVVTQLKSFSPDGIRSHLEESLKLKWYHFSEKKWDAIKYPEYIDDYSEKVINNLKEWGYELISKPPFKQSSEIKYQCNKKHDRTVTAASICMGSKCMVCAEKAPLNEEELQIALNILNLHAFSSLKDVRSNDHLHLGCLNCRYGILWDTPSKKSKSGKFTLRKRTIASHINTSSSPIPVLKNPDSPTRPECPGCKWMDKYKSYAQEMREFGKIESKKIKEWHRKYAKNKKESDIGLVRFNLLECVHNEQWDNIKKILKLPNNIVALESAAGNASSHYS